MLSIAVYSDSDINRKTIKSHIQDFLIEEKAMAKVSYFQDPEIFISAPGNYDICIMDMSSKDDLIELGLKMREIDPNPYYIFISEKELDAYRVAKARFNYFILNPIGEDELIETLTEIKDKVKQDSVVIKIASGERRIKVNHLNYINIVKRCLCYHLTNGTMFDGQTLRSSFEKAINPLPKHKAFLFLPPSLLINIGEIKSLYDDHIEFENDDILYYPKKHYDMVRKRWLSYNEIN